MKKISCNVIQDMLPLYIEKTACDDTVELIEEHLKTCETCRRSYQMILSELSDPAEKVLEISQEECETESSVEELRRFKRFLSQKRLQTALLSMVAVIVVFTGLIFFMNHYVRHLTSQEAGLIYIAENEEEVLFEDSVKGFYRWYNSLDRDNGVMTIHYEQSLWDRCIRGQYVPFDHAVTFLKKDVIKVVYLEKDGTETVIWEASEEEKKEYFSHERGNLG